MEILIAPIFIFISFFILFSLSRHDFVLIRQNISLAQVFDLALISIFFAFIVGRLLFVLNNFDLDLLHLVKFFYFIKFPGTSTLGFFIGGALSILFFLKKRKSIKRIFDIFILSFLPIYSFNIIFRNYPSSIIVIPLVLFILSWVVFFVLLDIHNKYKMKDGDISILTFIVLGLDSFILQIYSPDAYRIFFGMSLLQIISIFVVLISVSLIVIKRKLKHE